MQNCPQLHACGGQTQSKLVIFEKQNWHIDVVRNWHSCLQRPSWLCGRDHKWPTLLLLLSLLTSVASASPSAFQKHCLSRYKPSLKQLLIHFWVMTDSTSLQLLLFTWVISSAISGVWEALPHLIALRVKMCCFFLTSPGCKPYRPCLYHGTEQGQGMTSGPQDQVSKLTSCTLCGVCAEGLLGALCCNYCTVAVILCCRFYVSFI